MTSYGLFEMHVQLGRVTWIGTCVEKADRVL